MAYVRTVKTASGAVAVQIVHSNRRGSREIEHIGSGHTPGEVEVLKTVAQQRLHIDQDTLDFDDGQLGDNEAPIVSSQAGICGDAEHCLSGAGVGPGRVMRCSGSWCWPG